MQRRTRDDGAAAGKELQMRWITGFAALAASTTLAFAAPATAATASLVEAAATITAGQYAWDEAAPAVAGPVTVVVSIPLQQAFVYSGSTLVAVSTVSTGARGHETPVGDFTILQKDVNHRSSLYNAAPMPYMQRLTWDGIALHAGHNPGHADSHGCVRLPLAFAKRLYGITSLGARVVVTDQPAGPIVDNAIPAPVPAETAMASLAPDQRADAQATRNANLMGR